MTSDRVRSDQPPKNASKAPKSCSRVQSKTLRDVCYDGISDGLRTAISPQLFTCTFQFIKTNSLVFHRFCTPKKQQFHLK